MNISIVILLLIAVCSSVDSIRWFKFKFGRSKTTPNSRCTSDSSSYAPVPPLQTSSVSKTTQEKILMLRGGMQVFVKTLTGEVVAMHGPLVRMLLFNLVPVKLQLNFHLLMLIDNSDA